MTAGDANSAEAQFSVSIVAVLNEEGVRKGLTIDSTPYVRRENALLKL
jgi:hypothetical protein